MKCPTCGHESRKTKSDRPAAQTVELRLLEQSKQDTSRMTDAAVHQHYADIAPFMDVQAFLSHPLSTRLRDEAEALKRDILEHNGKHTAATKHAYRLLHERWRGWRNGVDAELRAGDVMARPEAA